MRAVESGASSAWFVVRTKPRRENFAQVSLARRGVETFFPRLIERSDAESESSVGPLFPNYLFARLCLDTQFNSVIWAPGVRNLVSFGESPAVVEPAVIDFIRDRCGAEGIVRVCPSFETGQWVRVRRGPLEGLVGVVEGQVGGQGRVRVLMELLRRRTCVNLPVAMLEGAEPAGPGFVAASAGGPGRGSIRDALGARRFETAASRGGA